MKTPLSEFVSAVVGNIPGQLLLLVSVTAFTMWVILGGERFVDFIYWAFGS